MRGNHLGEHYDHSAAINITINSDTSFSVLYKIFNGPDLTGVKVSSATGVKRETREAPEKGTKASVLFVIFLAL